MFTFHAKMSFSKEWTALINCYVVSPKGQWSQKKKKWQELDSRFLAVDSGSGNLNSGFQSVAVFRIPWAEFRNSNPDYLTWGHLFLFCSRWLLQKPPMSAKCNMCERARVFHLQVQLIRVDWRPMWQRYTAKDKLCMLHHHYRHVGLMPEGHSLIWTLISSWVWNKV